MDSRRPPVEIAARYLAAGNLPSGNGYGADRGKGITHWALDIANPVGADVVAPEDGAITHRWDDDTTAPFAGYGPGGVLMLGASGLFHLLAHMTPTVTIGQHVGIGDVVGRTARLAVASHCHWEVRVKPIDSPVRGSSYPYRGDNTVNPIAWLGGASTASSSGWWVVALVLAYVVSRSR